jgi:sec-independent protein translocase protein TatA
MYKPVLLFFNLGGGEIFIIMVVILLFFGSKRIPDLARGLGKGMREFKDAMSGVQRDIEDSIKPEDKKPIDKKNN